MTGKSRSITATAATLVALSVLLPAAKADGFRCDGQIVQRGDRAVEVRELCGDPDARVPLHTINTIRYGRVPVSEQWQYNLGPRRLMRFLTFRNGELRHIRTGRHGFREGPGHCRPGTLRIDMPQMELESRCGEPVEKTLTVAAVDHRRTRQGHFVARSVAAEEWLYDFGPNRFMRIVILVHGKVAKIERSSDRGSH
jgi:hypothetical protein